MFSLYYIIFDIIKKLVFQEMNMLNILISL